MATEVFELELFGGAVEKRYRKMRPEVETMPWGTLDASAVPEPVLVFARRTWTGAAFQEHRSAAACCATLRALIEARAPVDLIAVASRFPLDEMVHTELCARMAMELGGGTEILHEPSQLLADPDPAFPPLLRAAVLAVTVFCVGEAFSVPMLRGAFRGARHPLPRAVLARLVRDEAAHAAFGFSFLDWARPLLDEAATAELARHADLAIAALRDRCARTGSRRGRPHSLLVSQGRLLCARDEGARRECPPPASRTRGAHHPLTAAQPGSAPGQGDRE
jgi:hypothetical protein